jgi:hypothetical protein
MFKKFAIVLAPFLFAPISLSLTNSAAHAQTTAQWTEWSGRFTHCYFINGVEWSEWRALVQYRQSDYAARIVRIEFRGDEPLRLVEAWNTRDISGSRQPVDYANRLNISAGGRKAWMTSPAYYGSAYTSKLYPRYANVRFTRTDGSYCTADVGLPR